MSATACNAALMVQEILVRKAETPLMMKTAFRSHEESSERAFRYAACQIEMTSAEAVKLECGRAMSDPITLKVATLSDVVRAYRVKALVSPK